MGRVAGSTALPAFLFMERNTVQRRVIRNVFLQAGRPLSPNEVVDIAGDQKRAVGIATVYRNIKLLVDQDWLTPVEIPGEPSRYEISGKVHHHHFICRECHRAFDIEGCPGDMAFLAPTGFEIEEHEVILYGRCAGCASS